MKAVSLSMSVVATLALGLLATRAKATVVVDVRAVSASGGAVVTDDKDVVVSAIGQVVHFQAYARILGDDGIITNEGLQSSILSFVETRDSSLWEARGDMSAPARAAPFNALGSQDGHVLDLNADGDRDIGRLNGSGVSADSFVPRSGSMTMCTTSSDLPFATFDWTVTGIQTSGTIATTITCVPYMMTHGGVLYYIDGVFKSGFDATTPPGGGGTGVSVTAAAPTPFPGDANGDGTVNIADLSKVLTNYDKTGMQWADGDFNGDNTVNISDLSNVLTNYDKTAGSSAAGIEAVPEPSTLPLTASGVAGSLVCAWRRWKWRVRRWGSLNERSSNNL
jgi:hypothetical protein